MNRAQFRQWCKPRAEVRKPLVMGVLNVTPNSFSDGGRYFSLEQACQRAEQMVIEGADLIDVGGESTRPGSEPVSTAEELARVIPVIEGIRAKTDICISIDTSKAEVMQAAVSAGASIINDIKALKGEAALLTAAQLKVPVCLMHMQGLPKTMQDNPRYTRDIIDEINDFFRQRIEVCLEAGIEPENLILDPGFGFGKSVQHNLMIVKQFSEFQIHGLPLLLGVSRKSTIGTVLQKTEMERLSGSLAMAIFAVLQGASIIRAHDVDETKQAMQMIEAIVAADD